MGPTGSGKTLLAKTLAKVLDVPFAMVDASSFSEVGYAGEDVEDVESILTRLLDSTDGNVERAQKGMSSLKIGCYPKKILKSGDRF